METSPDLPIPISMIGGHYFLFSIDAVTYLRREHHICGVLIGSIPQAPQQNVFLGLPLELMAEEARLLVEKGLAYVVDDTAAHRQGLMKASTQRKRQYIANLQNTGRQAAIVQAGVKEQSRARALSRSRSKASKGSSVRAVNPADDEVTGNTETAHEESLFAPASPSEPASLDPLPVPSFGVNPATSALLLPPPHPPFSSKDELPVAPDSYPLFEHLHSKGYFSSPGLRFGCQYLVYPGDPLRFHSHFLASHVGWNEELDLMDLVGGGRLGTGVKKGYLIGGVENRKPTGTDESTENVRTFSVEWAGM